ncbi:hypothetical protein ACU8V1_13970 [Rhizobium leguminosarum]
MKTEYASNDLERVRVLINGKEWALYQLYSMSKTCVDLSNFLIASVGTPREQYAWMKMLYCYADNHGTIEQLRQAQLSNGRFDGPFHFQHSTTLIFAVVGTIANEVDLQAK